MIISLSDGRNSREREPQKYSLVTNKEQQFTASKL